MSTFTTNNTSSRIARPSSIGLINTPLSTQIITNRRRISNVNEDDNKVSLMKKKQKQIKAPNSHLSKSHSMQRLDQYLLGVDEQEEQVTKQMNRRALLSRATTTPMPRPSSLIKRFSEHTTGVLITTKQASSNVMKRSQSLANPVRNEEEIMGGGLVAAANFIFGQRVSIPSLGVAGTVRFFGETQFKRDAGHWVGIELDVKGAGKNDGSIQGVRYFTCPLDTGLFVPASKVVPDLEQYDSSNTAFSISSSSEKQNITPRSSKTSATTRKSHSSTTTTTAKRKSMIFESSTTTATASTATATATTNSTTALPKRNRSATTNTSTLNPSTLNPSTLNPSKSARTMSTRSNNQPLLTRSSPSAATKKASTTAKTSSVYQRHQTSKPTLKKSSSLSTSTNNHSCNHHRPQQQQQQRRFMHCSSSAKTKTQEITELQTQLEQSRQEQRALSQQMDGQEAAWERLVSAKESYAVLVQEKDNEIARLKRFIDQTHQDTDQLTKIASELDASQTRASMSEVMEKQHSKVIERLDSRVQSLQQDTAQLVQKHEAEILDRCAQVEQLRQQLAERDEVAAVIERECDGVRKTHIETVRAFESSIVALKTDHAQMIQNKDAQIARLQQMAQDFHQLYPPVTPVEEEDDMSLRRRLEDQLELSTRELDRERELIKSMEIEMHQLKDEIKRLHHVSINSNSQFYALRNELENEIQDKRRIMEEANAALEILARTEEENERIKMTNDKAQHDLADVLRKLATMEKQQRGSDEVHYLLTKNRELEAQNEKLQAAQTQSEHECMRLMDELLAIEKVGSEDTGNITADQPHMYQREIEQLKLQVVREAKRYTDLLYYKESKCEQLSKELADLESLVENKVFNETELEEAFENEKRKVRELELKLREEEEKNKNLVSKQQQQFAPMSPTSPQYSLFHRQQSQPKRSSTESFSLMISSSLDTVSDHGNLLESVYCEICEEYGHDVMTCDAFTAEKDTMSSSSCYCVNCDVFGIHPTEDCPNQDETY